MTCFFVTLMIVIPLKSPAPFVCVVTFVHLSVIVKTVYVQYV